MNIHAYFMDSALEGNRIERKTDAELTRSQLRWAGLRPGLDAVDVGCAAGTTTRIIAAELAGAGSVTGIDASAARIADARQRTPTGDVRYVQGVVEDLPFADGEYDFVWCRFLFEYIADRERAFQELVRVTRPRGTVCVSDLDGNGIWTEPLAARLLQERDEAVRTLMTTGFDPRVGRKLYALAVNAGLTNLRVDVRPYNVMAGRVTDPEVRARWELKHRAIEAALVRLGWGDRRAARLIDEFRARLDRDDVFTYCAIVTVAGDKREDG